MRGSAPRPAGGNNFPRPPLFCPLRMPRGRRVKGGPCSAFSASAIPGFPPFLQRFAIIRRIPFRVVCAAWGHTPVAFAITFPTVAPPRLLRSPSPRFLRFPLFIMFLGCSRSPASTTPQPRRSPSRLSAGPFRPPRLFSPAVSPQSLARAPAFPSAPSFLTHASRSFCDTLATQPAPRADPRFLRPSPSCAPSPPTVFPIASPVAPTAVFLFCVIYKCRIFY